MSAADHAQYDITFARKTYHCDILPNQSVMIGALPSVARAGVAHHGWAAPGEKFNSKRPKRDFVIKKVNLKLPILVENECGKAKETN